MHACNKSVCRSTLKDVSLHVVFTLAIIYAICIVSWLQSVTTSMYFTEFKNFIYQSIKKTHYKNYLGLMPSKLKITAKNGKNKKFKHDA